MFDLTRRASSGNKHLYRGVTAFRMCKSLKNQFPDERIWKNKIFFKSAIEIKLTRYSNITHAVQGVPQKSTLCRRKR
jgi:hypothetical protein